MSHHCCLHRHVSLVLMVPLLFEHGGQLVVSVVVQLVLGTANCSNKGRRARSLVATIWSQPREGWENEQDLGLRSRARSRDVQVQGEGDVSCYVTRAVFRSRCSLALVSVGEMAHLGEKNTGIWDSQIWDPRYLVPLFLVNFPIEAFKFNR